ncbi:MAG: beta-galactosidase [Thermomicrobium sp.]|nr:beta-galactosidase [Thermomicrobium sp.]MDW8059165.1 beta-galactosidase [Thermomicrobium sp.]
MQRRRFLAALCAGLAVTACRGPVVYPSPTPDSRATGAPTATSVPLPLPVTPSAATQGIGFAYGFNVAWRGDEEGEEFNRRTAEFVRAAGFRWIRIQAQWESHEPQPGQWDLRPLDRVLPIYAEYGLEVLVSVVSAPQWARDTTGAIVRDPGDFRNAMRRFASRYRGRVRAWQLWNEQNIASNVYGPIRVESYARLLRAGYEGVKEGDPDALVVSGSLTPTGVNDPNLAIDDVAYLEAFYALDGGAWTRYFDILGAHANATLNPPDTLWPERPGPGPGWRDHPSFYFRRVEQLRAVMERHQDQRAVWITEFGWTTANPAPGYEYGQYVSEEQQAEYLVEAFRIARDRWPWVTGMFVWNLNFSTIVGPTDEKGPWSVLASDWTPRPAYRALQAMPKRP